MSPGAVLLMLSTVAAPLPDQPVYKWKFEKGRSFYQEVTTDIAQTMKVGGQDIAMTQQQAIVFCFTPVKQEGDTWVLRQTIEALRVQVDVGGNKIVFDSTKSAADDTAAEMAKLYKAMTGWECRVTLDPSRKVVKLEGAEELAERVAKESGNAKDTLKYLFAEESLRALSSHSFNALPGRRVEKGENWSRISRTDLGPIGHTLTTYEYVYSGKDGKCDKFDVTSADTKYHLPAPGMAGTPPFTLKKMDLKTKKATGAILFDAVRGRVDRSELTTEVGGDLSIDIGGAVTDIVLSQKQKLTVQTTDSNPWQK